MKRTLGIGLVLLLASALACAAGPGAARKKIESSLLVSGWIDLDAAGHVERFDVDQPDKLPKSVLSLLGSKIPQWTFEPVLVDGRATTVRTNMSVRIVAKRIDDERIALTLGAADFSGDKEAADSVVTARQMEPPPYPENAGQANVQGTVYLLLKVGLDGSVVDSVAEQVNLRVAGSDGQMDRGRAMLSRAALRTAQRWTFNVPASNDAAGSFRSVRVPVDFMLGTGPRRGYGQWDAYIPGPRQSAPWLPNDIDRRDGPDALAAGGVRELGSGPKLLSALDAG